MIIFYWDDKSQANRWEPDVVSGQVLLGANGENTYPARPRGHLWDLLLQNSVHTVSKEYDQPGIWMVTLYGYLHEISGHGHTWNPKTGEIEEKFDPDQCKTLINALPEHVKLGMRNRKLVVVIDNGSEGKDLNYTEVYYLQTAMKNAGLPRGSLVVCSGACNMDQTYYQMCKDLNNRRYWEVGDPMVDFMHVPCFENPANLVEFDEPTPNPILKAIQNPESKDFMSLNQTIKPHRMEHLFWIINENFADRGLINGSWVREGRIQWRKFISIAHKPTIYFKNVLNSRLLDVTTQVLPLQADHDCTQSHCDYLPNNHGQFNNELYERSLLSFVTESEFSANQNSIFLTEKTHKTMIGGHPFILLGTQGSIKYLQSQGYKMQFCDIDLSYDSLTDHVKRFTAAHDELRAWLSKSRQQQIDLINRDMHILNHNRNKAIKETMHVGEADLRNSRRHLSENLMVKIFNDIEKFLSAKLEVMQGQYTPSEFSNICGLTAEQDDLLKDIIAREVAIGVEIEHDKSALAWRDDVYAGIPIPGMRYDNGYDGYNNETFETQNDLLEQDLPPRTRTGPAPRTRTGPAPR